MLRLITLSLLSLTLVLPLSAEAATKKKTKVANCSKNWRF